MTVGFWVLALPLAVTEEVWNLSKEFSTGQIVTIAIVSMAVLSGFVHYRFYSDAEHPRRREFIARVVTAYGVPLISSVLILWAIHRVTLQATRRCPSSAPSSWPCRQASS